MTIGRVTGPIFKEMFESAMDEWNLEFYYFQFDVYQECDKKFVQGYLDSNHFFDLRNVPVDDRKEFIIRLSDAYAHETGNIVGKYDW